MLYLVNDMGPVSGVSVINDNGSHNIHNNVSKHI